MRAGITSHPSPIQKFRRTYTLECLENRCMLSASSAEGTVDPATDPQNDPLVSDVGNDEATELWHIIAQDELFDSVADAEGQEPLPVVPVDDSTSPDANCSELDGEFCLPGDANQDGTVDFSDFLLLNENFGLQGAGWEDGDFDGDGVVALADFLILSEGFGSVA